MSERIPTTFEVKCGCGHVHVVRTKEPEHRITCWKPGCNRGIKIILGTGRNNYRVYIVEGGREKQVRPISVVQ